ncbi:PHP domain-containing protein [Rhodothermaceae bacterium RA]|nr:PHP domain-containing protein [Rhodothermaceae bacterium RA]
MPRSLLLLVLLALLVPAAPAQHTHKHTGDRAITFPDVPGYQTLVCDFHTHSVFSDGSVWPNIRVEEAVRDGLDALAITEHLEYQPHAEDIPHPDRNRAYDLAVEFAQAHDLIVIRGSEVTRSMPPGHVNAIFLKDANALLRDDVRAVFEEVRRQGGFAFWNHPNWTAQRPDGLATLTDLHRELIAEGLLKGIEVVNDVTYSDEALQIALDHGLTILGTSDIHGLIDWQYEVPEGGHRPVTLVFATERSEAGIQAALEAGRTVAWFNNLLVGREDVLQPLLEAALTVTDATYPNDDRSVLSVTIRNTSDAAFLLDNQTDFTFHSDADVITVGPHQSQRLEVKTGRRRTSVRLVFEVLNAVTAPNTHPHLVFDVTVD